MDKCGIEFRTWKDEGKQITQGAPIAIINTKYGNKRIGVLGIKDATCLADAEKYFENKKGWDNCRYYGYQANWDYITAQKNFEFDEGFVLINIHK